MKLSFMLVASQGKGALGAGRSLRAELGLVLEAAGASCWVGSWWRF